MSSYQVSRRNLLKSMGVASVGAFLAACAPAPVGVPSSDTEAGAAPVAATPTTLNALFPSAVLADEYYQALSDRFKEATGITVEFSLLPFERLMDRELTLSAAQSDDVDIFATHYAQIGRFAEALAPLNDFAERDAISGEAYVQGSFDAFTINNNLLAIPTTFDLRALYYRTDLFGAAGIEAPPATRDDLLEVAQALNNPPELYGYLTVGKGDPALREFSDLLWENGGDFLENGLEPSLPIFNQDAGVEALQWWYDLIHTNKVSFPGTAAYEWRDQTGLYASGQAVMAKLWNPGPLEDPAQSVIVDQYGIAPIPAGPVSGRTTTVCHARAVNNFSSKTEAAWEFLKFEASEENWIKREDRKSVV